MSAMSAGKKWFSRGTAAAVLAVAGVLTTPTATHAQDEIAPINAGNWSFEMGADVVTEYWFRGISQGPANTKGFIPQLWADAAVLLFEGEQYSLAVNVGTWNSFTSSNAGGGLLELWSRLADSRSGLRSTGICAHPCPLDGQART